MAYPNINASASKVIRSASLGSNIKTLKQSEMPFGTDMWDSNCTIKTNKFMYKEDQSYRYYCTHKEINFNNIAGDPSKTPDDGSSGSILSCGRGKSENTDGIMTIGVNETVDRVKMSMIIYLGSTDDIAFELTLLLNSTQILKLTTNADEFIQEHVCYHNGSPNYSIPNISTGAIYSPGMLLKITNMDVTDILKNPGSYSLKAQGKGLVSGKGGGFELKYMQVAVAGGIETQEPKTHTETQTEVHTTTTTTTTSFPATSGGDIHVLKDGVESLVPLYTDADIQNSPGNGIEHTFFYSGASKDGTSYKMWMAENGASHPAVDISPLCGYGYGVLGYYLKKGKDFETTETSTYTEVVTITVPGGA